MTLIATQTDLKNLNNAHVNYSVRNHVAYINFNRSEKMNSLHRGMLIQLSEFLTEAEMDRSVRVIVLGGSGNSFCTGQDLKEILDENPPSVHDLLSNFHDPIVEKIRSIKKPIIAAVNGVAAGAGAVFAVACDLVIASDKASFIFGFSHIGLTSGSGGSYFLSRLVGAQKAAALLMLGEKISAQSAEQMGMIYKVLGNETFETEIIETAEKMASLPALSLALTKELLSKALVNDLSTQILHERESKCLAGSSCDFEEGLSAFVSKRKPIFNINTLNSSPEISSSFVQNMSLSSN